MVSCSVQITILNLDKNDTRVDKPSSKSEPGPFIWSGPRFTVQETLFYY